MTADTATMATAAAAEDIRAFTAKAGEPIGFGASGFTFLDPQHPPPREPDAAIEPVAIGETEPQAFVRFQPTTLNIAR